MKKLTLVVGHKLGSEGAYNEAHDLTEFGFNNLLAANVAERARQAGLDVAIVYRDTYKKLPDKINSVFGDVILSMHCNAYDTTKSGSETLYYYKSGHGYKLAKLMQKHVLKALGLRDRGLKPRSVEERGGYVLKYTKAPCVILEPFFIDNDDDLEIAMDYFDELAQAYVDGVLEFLN